MNNKLFLLCLIILLINTISASAYVEDNIDVNLVGYLGELVLALIGVVSVFILIGFLAHYAGTTSLGQLLSHWISEFFQFIRHMFTNLMLSAPSFFRIIFFCVAFFFFFGFLYSWTFGLTYACGEPSVKTNYSLYKGNIFSGFMFKILPDDLVNYQQMTDLHGYACEHAGGGAFQFKNCILTYINGFVVSDNFTVAYVVPLEGLKCDQTTIRIWKDREGRCGYESYCPVIYEPAFWGSIFGTNYMYFLEYKFDGAEGISLRTLKWGSDFLKDCKYDALDPESGYPTSTDERFTSPAKLTIGNDSGWVYNTAIKSLCMKKKSNLFSTSFKIVEFENETLREEVCGSAEYAITKGDLISKYFKPVNKSDSDDLLQVSCDCSFLSGFEGSGEESCGTDEQILFAGIPIFDYRIILLVVFVTVILGLIKFVKGK